MQLPCKSCRRGHFLVFLHVFASSLSRLPFDFKFTSYSCIEWFQWLMKKCSTNFVGLNSFLFLKVKRKGYKTYISCVSHVVDFTFIRTFWSVVVILSKPKEYVPNNSISSFSSDECAVTTTWHDTNPRWRLNDKERAKDVSLVNSIRSLSPVTLSKSRSGIIGFRIFVRLVMDAKRWE